MIRYIANTMQMKEHCRSKGKLTMMNNKFVKNSVNYIFLWIMQLIEDNRSYFYIVITFIID